MDLVLLLLTADDYRARIEADLHRLELVPIHGTPAPEAWGA